jgi:site-specific DNA recombinase
MRPIYLGMLHEKFEELLDLISFSEAQVTKIIFEANKFLLESTKQSAGVVEERTKQLADVNKKVDRLEERLMNDEIDGVTYKKWLQKYSQDRALLSDALIKASLGTTESKWNKIQQLIPHLTSLKSIYRIATLPRKQALIRRVFKHEISYFDGALEHL